MEFANAKIRVTAPTTPADLAAKAESISTLQGTRPERELRALVLSEAARILQYREEGPRGVLDMFGHWYGGEQERNNPELEAEFLRTEFTAHLNIVTSRPDWRIEVL